LLAICFGLRLLHSRPTWLRASNVFEVQLSPPRCVYGLLPDSAFGINNAFYPDMAELDARVVDTAFCDVIWAERFYR
jgi:hypothetical protein